MLKPAAMIEPVDVPQDFWVVLFVPRDAQKESTASVYRAFEDVADVEEAFRRARKAQEKWSRTTLKEREALFMRLHDIVLERQDEIMDLICWESGKARKHAFDEPLHIALTARYYARTAPGLLALRATLQEYRERMHSNEPVHTWD